LNCSKRVKSPVSVTTFSVTGAVVTGVVVSATGAVSTTVGVVVFLVTLFFAAAESLPWLFQSVSHNN
jgi:hypothetical protein